jgi:hypothetical protein
MIRTIFLAVIAVAAVTYAMILKQDMNERDNQIAQLGRDLAAARDAAAKAGADAAAARHEVTGLNDNIARLTAERDAARAKAKEGGAAGVAAAGDGQTPKGNEKSGNPMNAFAKMFESEDGKKMMKAQMGMVTKMQYGDLARLLKLSPDMSEQVMSLLNDRQAAMAEESFKMMGGNMDEAGMKEMGKKAEAVKKDYDEKLKAVLGAEKFQQMQDYDKTLGDRMMMAQFDQQFSSSGSPLQSSQRDQLMQIMAEERKRSQPQVFDTTGLNPGKGLDALKDDAAVDRFLQQEADYHQRVLNAATKTLNPDQINALQQTFKQMAEMQKFGIKMSREMIKSGGNAVPAPVVEVK